MYKKIFPLIVVASALIFAGCSKKNETTVASTPAQKLCAEFKSIVSSNKNIDMETLAMELSENEIIPFGAAVMPIEPGYLNGFSNEITGFSSGAFFGPMIGAIPFVGYVFEVEGDVKNFINTLTESADLRWNICTQADEMVYDSVGKKVFFAMAPTSFDEE